MRLRWRMWRHSRSRRRSVLGVAVMEGLWTGSGSRMTCLDFCRSSGQRECATSSTTGASRRMARVSRVRRMCREKGLARRDYLGVAVRRAWCWTSERSSSARFGQSMRRPPHMSRKTQMSASKRGWRLRYWTAPITQHTRQTPLARTLMTTIFCLDLPAR